MYKISFTLKQHTPLIHFQHEQEGATLRATEVKPKLDRFIIKQLELTENVNGKVIVKDRYKHWFINEEKQHLALNYKMRLNVTNETINTNLIALNEKANPFFGNMGAEQYVGNIKSYHIANGIIQNEINTTLLDLKNELQTHISDFFSCTNFGTRQTKGFGSFTINETKVKGHFASFQFKGNTGNNCRKVFEAIDLFYRSLRGGIRIYNRNGCAFYFKSMLVSYYHSKKLITDLDWDKAAIKEAIRIRKDNSGVDIKDLLGFSSVESWKADYNTTVSKTDRNNNTDRFMSPLIFKPVYHSNNKWTVYIFLNEIPDVIKSTTLIAKVNRLNIKLDLWKDFDLKDFAKYVLSHNSEEKIESHIEKYSPKDASFFKKNENYNLIVDIYSTLNTTTNE